MTQRKSWTEVEDKVLKILKHKCGDKKWSQIAQLMRAQYGIQGRNGKQCRERYHNHLDQRILKTIWKPQQDQLLLCLHNKFGNRWAHIARVIEGRTDNCVKNRFYSRFRRSIRAINEMIKIFWKKQFKPLKITFISKIIQITQQLRESSQENKKQLFETCEDLKCRLMSFSDCTSEMLRINKEHFCLLYNLIKDVNLFNKKNKRRGKKKRRECSDDEEDENFQFVFKTDVKLNSQNMKMEVKKNKQCQNIKIQHLNESEPVKIEQHCFIKQQYESTQKIMPDKNQEMEGQIFANHLRDNIEKPICISNEECQKFFSLCQIKSSYVEEGFDINQFYSLENLYDGHKGSYY